METDKQKAMSFALRSLSYAPKTTYQICKQLKDKGFSDDIIEETILRLKSWSYVDDEGWIHSYIEKHKKRHHGPKYILKKLLEKHIPNNVAFKAVENHYKDEEETYWIRSFLESKSTTITSSKDKSFILKKLLSRGFRYERILSELSTISTPFHQT